MKINIIDSTTHQPYANRAVLIQLKDQVTGQIKSTLTLRSSQEGVLTLDQKFEGLQIAASVNGTQSKWVEAVEDAKIEIKAIETLSQNTQKQSQDATQKQGVKEGTSNTNTQKQFSDKADKTESRKPTPEKS